MSKWQPFWTDEVTIENGGRYPLLLNRFHDHLEENLIKGIVSVTDRLRYISYCCWIIGDIEKTVKPTKYYEFEEAFRRRESALAVGTYLLKPETVMGNYTTYGRDVMRGKVKDINDIYKTSFTVLPSNNLGAYGQYYKGTMQNWGLTYIDDNGIVCLTELGMKLYKIMEGIYQNADYYIKYRGKNSVPGQVLYDWALINQYDNIMEKKHREERDFYKSVIFHLDLKKVTDGRRDTFTIYLECIADLKKNRCQFNEDNLRNILFYQKYFDEDCNLHKCELSPALQNTRFIWMIYEMQVYFRWWISEYFRAFLRLLSGHPKGLAINEIMCSLDKDSFNNVINEYTKKVEDYYNMKFGDLYNSIVTKYNDGVLLWEDEICYNSWNSSFSGFSEIAAGLIMILSMLKIKFEQIRTDNRYLNIRMNLSEDFYFKDIMEISESISTKSITEVLELILTQFVIRQHNNAMYEKRDLRRCWFTVWGNKYQYQADSSSIWRPAKHNIICNFLCDMGLIECRDETFILTEEGKELYVKLKDEYYEEQLNCGII